MISENKKISIVIPVYNGEKTLRECLSSVLDQTYSNFEFLIVDNNSTDKTKEIIKSFQNKNSRVKYLFEPQQGVGAARNTGEKIASGEIILMTDSDCLVPQNWISEMVKPIIIGQAQAVQGFQEPMVINFWSDQYQSRSAAKYQNVESFDEGAIGMIDTKNFAIKASTLKDVGFTDRRYIIGNDMELSIRLDKNGIKAIFLKDVKVKHWHATSLKVALGQQMSWAAWSSVAVCQHKDYLKKSNFLEKISQTKKSFFKIPPLIKRLKTKGLKSTGYDLLTGLAWRVGVIKGRLNFFIQI